jgi:hypothetical protein
MAYSNRGRAIVQLRDLEGKEALTRLELSVLSEQLTNCLQRLSEILSAKNTLYREGFPQIMFLSNIVSSAQAKRKFC